MSIELSNHSYKYFKVSNKLLHNISGLHFPFATEWKKIGVNLSGGADSACGTAVLCSLITQLNLDIEIIVISHNRVWNKRPWASYISADVFEKIQSMFPNIKMSRVVNYIPPELEHGSIGYIDQLTTPDGVQRSCDEVSVDSFNRYVSEIYNLDAVYNFTTNNPADETFKHSDAPQSRNWTVEKICSFDSAKFPVPQIVFNREKAIELLKLRASQNTTLTYNDYTQHKPTVLPWLMVSKDFVVKLYKDNNWIELFNLTRSCEGDIQNLYGTTNISSYQHNTTPLKTCLDARKDSKDYICYWCAERQWAIDKNQ